MPMNLSEEINRIHNLNFFLLKEQSLTPIQRITSSDIRIEGPYELRGDGNLYNLRADLSLVKGADLQVRYNIINNFSKPVVIKNVKFTGEGLKNTSLSTKNLAPSSFATLTLNIGTINQSQADLPGYDKAQLSKPEIVTSNFSGTITIEGPKIQSPFFGASNQNENFVIKQLPSFTVKVPKNYYFVDAPEKYRIPVLFDAFDWVASWNAHDWLLFAEIAASLAMMLTPAGWVAGLIALGAGGANAYLYFDEGDNFNGWFNLIFSIIPAVDLIKAIPAISKYGIEGSLKILWRAKASKITKEELAWLNQFMKQSSKNKELIYSLLKSNLGRMLIKALYTLPTPMILKILVILKKVGLFTGTLVLVVMGLSYTVEYVLYLMGVEKKDVQPGTEAEVDWNIINNPDNQEEIKTQAIGLMESGLEPLDDIEVLEVISTAGKVQQGDFEKTLDSIQKQNRVYFDSLQKTKVNSEIK